MTELEAWVTEAAEALGLPDDINHALVLDLSREVAHAIVRPAAPLTSYLLGLAVARGADPVEAAATLTALAQRHAT